MPFFTGILQSVLLHVLERFKNRARNPVCNENSRSFAASLGTRRLLVIHFRSFDVLAEPENENMAVGRSTPRLSRAFWAATRIILRHC